MTDRPAIHTLASSSASESLHRLAQFAKELGTVTDLAAAAERILTELMDAARHEHGALYLFEPECDHYHRQSSVGISYSESGHATIAASHPLPQLLTARQQIVQERSSGRISSAVAGQPRRDDAPPSYDLALPLVNRGRLVAFVLLAAPSETDPAESDRLDLLSTLGQIAANTLDSLVARDDLRQSQALMRRTDRLRSLEIIAGGFAHEIRNPLTSIKTFIQLAPDRKNDTEFIRDFSRIVLDDVLRIERLIQEILDYARYMEPKLTEEDFNDIVASCLYFIDVTADSRAIKIEKELAPGLPRVMLDRQQIKQVLLNLFLNAMDAMGEQGGTLRVRTSRLVHPQGTVSVQAEIEDTGHGISPANLAHIFDPFFTTKQTGEEREGTGLGLTIAHQIVQEHQGTLRVTSAEGVGTTFFVTLPALP